MKNCIMVLVVGAGLLLAGCATQSPYVGAWKGQETDKQPFLLSVTHDGNFVVLEETGEAQTSGRWAINKENLVVFSTSGNPQMITGFLLNPDELILSDEGGKSVKCARQ